MRESLCLLVIFLLGLTRGQRLSQGASDWYMRFHDYGMVKRASSDPPVTSSFVIDSQVNHRYAITKVTTSVHNPAKLKQVFNFGFVTPSSAFISDVTLSRAADDELVTSKVDESEWVTLSLKNGQRIKPQVSQEAGMAFPVLARADLSEIFSPDEVSFKQFVLPIHLGPGDNVTLTFTYEYLLVRDLDSYNHILSLSPGETVADFQIKVTVKEARDLIDLNVTSPVLGDLTADLTTVKVNGEGDLEVDFSMNEVEQSHYFGRHGFTGDFSVAFDVRGQDHSQPDVTVDGQYFLHFYDVPEQMESIPKHVIFVLDHSESMTGPKTACLKDAVKYMMKSTLDEDRDYFNVLTFDAAGVQHWLPETITEEEAPSRAYPASANLTSEMSDWVEGLEGVTEGPANLSEAVLEALDLDKKIWDAGELPENTYTVMIVLTDGRGHAVRSEAKLARKMIRQANKISRIPIVILGMGFDANMAFLENVAEKSGAKALNVIEDLEVEPQIAVIQTHLNDVVIKNLRLNYVGDAFDQDTITRTNFKAFHQGRSIAVAGKWLSESEAESPFNAEFEVEVTGQSADGLYMEHPVTFPFSDDEECEGEVILCSEMNLEGDCVSVDMSRANLRQLSFSNQAASLNITGDCAWIAYKEAYYSGSSVALMPGEYQAIPDLHKSISSLKRIPKSKLYPSESAKNETDVETGKLLKRVWSYLTIQDTLVKLELRPDSVSDEELAEVTRIALENQFLTPFTDLYLEEVTSGRSEVEPENRIVENNYVTFKELNPVFLSMDDPDIARQWEALKDCQSPVTCHGNFHVEELPETPAVVHADNCTGELTLFTRPNFEGESYSTKVSLHQLYHAEVSQRLRSLEVTGECCWLLFDQRFFSGKVDKVCGGSSQSLRSLNIGSVKRISPPPAAKREDNNNNSEAAELVVLS